MEFAILGFGIVVFLFIYMNGVVLAQNKVIEGLREIIREYNHKTNLLMAESRVEVPPDRLVAQWITKYKEAPKGSAKKAAYKHKLDEYNILAHGNRYSE